MADRSPKYIPSVRARRLARSLREHRETAGLGVTAAAAALGWSQGKVSHIESGRNKPRITDVGVMLDLYGVTSPERDALLALARDAGHRGWWTAFDDVFAGPYVALEDDAAEICHWAPLLVPGLLQTPDFAREIIKAALIDDTDNTEDEIERRLRARMARQTILTRTNPPHLHVILCEGVLGRDIGGPAVMRDQIYRLHAESQRPNITLQILPRACGAHIGFEGPFILLRFAEPADPDVGYVEGFHGAVYLEAPAMIAKCSVAFERLRTAALDPEESAALLDAAKR